MSLPRLLKPLGRSQPEDIKDDLENWFNSELGQQLLQKQKTILENVLPRFFGYHLIYSGFHFLDNCLDTSPIRHKIFLNHSRDSLKSNIHALPFQSDSTDLVVLHHSLDIEKDPFQVLRETSRIILPNGNLVIMGFNPWSFWGLWRSVLFRSSKAPWSSRFISPYRLSEWLDILGFDVVGCESAFFSPPVSSIARKELGLDFLGSAWLAQRGGFYLLVAKKRVSCITPIRLQNKTKRGNILPIAATGKVKVHQRNLDEHKQ